MVSGSHMMQGWDVGIGCASNQEGRSTHVISLLFGSEPAFLTDLSSA